MALTQNDIYPSLIGLATKSLGFVRSVSYYVGKEIRWHVNDLPWLTQGAYEFLTSYVARRHQKARYINHTRPLLFKPRVGRLIVLDSEVESHTAFIACSQAPTRTAG